MTDGEALKQFIDNQTKSKVKIAEDLGMSRQNLFQYFKSSTLNAETKKKFEDYFNKSIFTNLPIINQGSLKKGTQIKTTGESIDLSPEFVNSLKAQIKLLEKINEGLEKRLDTMQANLSEVLANQKVLTGMLSVAMNNSWQLPGANLRLNCANRKEKETIINQ